MRVEENLTTSSQLQHALALHHPVRVFLDADQPSVGWFKCQISSDGNRVAAAFAERLTVWDERAAGPIVTIKDGLPHVDGGVFPIPEWW